MYLGANEGLYSSNNATIIEELTAVVKTLECPCIAAGGWNAEPAELCDAGVFTLLQGEILCFNKRTLDTGGELDYAVVSKRFRPYCSCELERSVPWTMATLCFQNLRATGIGARVLPNPDPSSTY